MVRVTDKSEKGQETGPPSSIMSDGSFVILERSAAPPLPNGEQSLSSPGSMAFPPSSIPHHPNESLSSSFVPGSFPDLSPEEIQKKLTEVLQENVELKETLHQNNLAMKQQFNTLVMWQDEVFKVHQTHKEKFQETKELILKLRAENAELKNYLEMKSGTSSDAQLKAENARLQGQVAELQQRLSAPMPRPRDSSAPAGGSVGPTKKEEELTALAQQLTRQVETAERARRQLIMEVEGQVARRERVERELEEAQRECAALRAKAQQCEQDLQSFVCVEQEQGASHKEVQQMHAELERAAHHVQELERELQEQRQVHEAVKKQLHETQSTTQQQPESVGSSSFVAALRSCAVKMQEVADSLIRQTERYASLDKWLQSASMGLQPWRPSGRDSAAALAQLRTDIAGLRKVLVQEQAYGAEKKANLSEAQEKLEQLFAEHEALMRAWQEERSRAQSNEQKNERRNEQRNELRNEAHESAFRELQAKGFSEQLDRLTAQVLCKDEELKIRDEEEKTLKERVRQLEQDSEAMAILKAQVEVYQSDFNAEREAREHLAGERDRLAEDLRHLQRRNQQLLDEMEALQRTHFEHLQNAPATGGVTAAPGTPASGWNTIAAPGHGRKQASPEPRHNPQVERHSPPKAYDEEIPPPKEYVCPLCKMAFRQLNLLEFHVETCLDS